MSKFLKRFEIVGDTGRFLLDSIGVRFISLLALGSVSGILIPYCEFIILFALNAMLSSENKLELNHSFLTSVINSIGTLDKTGASFLLLFGAMGRTLFAFLSGQTNNIVTERFRETLLNKLLKQFLHDEQQRIQPSDLQYRANDILPRAANYFLCINAVIVSALQSLGLIVILFMTSTELTLFAIFGLVFVYAIIKQFNNVIKRNAKEIPKEQKLLFSLFEKLSRNRLLFIISGTQKVEHGDGAMILRRYRDAVTNAGAFSVASTVAPQMLGMLLVIGLIFLPSMINLTMSTQALLVYLVLFLRYLQNLASTNAVLSRSHIFKPSFLEALDLFKRADLRSDLNSFDSDEQQDSSPPSIQFIDVSFKYKSNSDFIFRNLTFEAGAGKSIAIIGPSGSGKSTIINLIIGSFEANEGQILINGRSSRSLPKHARLGYAGPEPYLFAGSVRDNLLYGLHNKSIVSDVSILKVLASLGLEDKFPSDTSLNQILSESSSNLSTGQKQRLCFARAVIRQPQVLILDEVTANLDPLSEESVLNFVLKLSKWTTVVWVTHNPNIALKLDSIVKISSTTESLNQK